MVQVHDQSIVRGTTAPPRKINKFAHSLKLAHIVAFIEEGIPGCLVKNFVTNLSLNLVKNSVISPNSSPNLVKDPVRCQIW